MPAETHPDWEIIGWKVWVVESTQIDVYSSKTHDWAIDVPSQGIQFMYRYRRHKLTGRLQREAISGKDFYTVDSQDRFLAIASPFVKTGVLNTDRWYEAKAKMETDRFGDIDVDNSIDKYTSTSKRSIGWEVYAVGDNNTLAVYRSNTHTWADVPNTGILMMFRLWKDGPAKWKEAISREDIYLEDRDNETSIVGISGKLKVGSVIDPALFTQVNDLASADTEVF